MWSSLNRFREGALLFLRLGLGSFYIFAHGWSRMAGGPAAWKTAGKTMKQIGISFTPELWGFLGAFAATVAVGFLIIGFCFRPACVVILIALAVVAAIAMETSGLGKASHSIELAILMITLLFVGPGRYSFDKA